MRALQVFDSLARLRIIVTSMDIYINLISIYSDRCTVYVHLIRRNLASTVSLIDTRRHREELLPSLPPRRRRGAHEKEGKDGMNGITSE